ncbi:uncharacterized protein [Bos mutus]|uniref:uncharacterized protein n=1 Tax=Bos mutus TaxID=72004 RepID=UPI0038B55C56
MLQAGGRAPVSVRAPPRPARSTDARAAAPGGPDAASGAGRGWAVGRAHPRTGPSPAHPAPSRTGLGSLTQPDPASVRARAHLQTRATPPGPSLPLLAAPLRPRTQTDPLTPRPSPKLPSPSPHSSRTLSAHPLTQGPRNLANLLTPHPVILPHPKRTPIPS